MNELRKLYDELEDDNDHNMCAMLLAVACRDREAAIRIAQMMEHQNREGGMTGALCEERYEIQKPLWERFKEMTG